MNHWVWAGLAALIGYFIGAWDQRRLRALLRHERKRQSAMHAELKRNGCQWFD
jgi:uncharacterized membrane-anchored protein YhcB (DUF1043 family)